MTENSYITSAIRYLNTMVSFIFVGIQEEFEDTKGAIRIRISKKNRQHIRHALYKLKIIDYIQSNLLPERAPLFQKF